MWLREHGWKLGTALVVVFLLGMAVPRAAGVALSAEGGPVVMRARDGRTVVVTSSPDGGTLYFWRAKNDQIENAGLVEWSVQKLDAHTAAASEVTIGKGGK